MMHKKPSGMKAAFHIYAIFMIAVIVLAAAGIGSIAYAVYINKPDGQLATSAWPKDFTDQFSKYISVADGTPVVDPEGIRLLAQYDLWFQLLDEEGKVILPFGSTADRPSRYSVTELIRLGGGVQSGGKETIYLGTLGLSGGDWYYIIGYPLRIATVTTYLNGSHFTNGRAYIMILLICGFLLVILAGFAYGIWITLKMRKVTASVVSIAARTYRESEGKGFLKDVYQHLNRLDHDIRVSDYVKAETERQREEWITNMTHDIKTPLSPIKGYAELLEDTNTDVNAGQIQAYAKTILKNANQAERLINDLKLMYQMKGGIIPLAMERTNVARFVKEAVISLLNMPLYAGCDIRFESCCGEAYAMVDEPLMVRALNNIIINAIVHNPPETYVAVSVMAADEIEIRVLDNGKGISLEESERMFDRYFRGACKGDKPEGSGLGLAIAKQVTILHNGTIKAESVLGQGTEIIITLPKA